VSLLEDFLSTDHTKVIIELKYNEITLVDKNIIDGIIKDLEMEEWLPMFEEN
jgi:hypothetical protein